MRCELLPLLVRKQIKQIVNTNYTVFADRIYSKKQDTGLSILGFECFCNLCDIVHCRVKYFCTYFVLRIVY